MKNTEPEREGKLLAIEDDPEVLSLYVHYLRKRGFEVLATDNARDAIGVLAATADIRLIILDLGLPGMSGEEWLEWYSKSGHSLPVIVASGKNNLLSVTKGRNNYAALNKPFHMDELLELIDAMLAGEWNDSDDDPPRLRQ